MESVLITNLIVSYNVMRIYLGGRRKTERRLNWNSDGFSLQVWNSEDNVHGEKKTMKLLEQSLGRAVEDVGTPPHKLRIIEGMRT